MMLQPEAAEDIFLAKICRNKKKTSALDLISSFVRHSMMLMRL